MTQGTQNTLAIERSRLVDYWILTKPELTFLSVVTALTGYYLGADGSIQASLLLHTLFGTALVGGGAGALNQYIEREYDGLMRRTENRPVPSGRVQPYEALLFGIILSIVGIAELVLFTNPLTGFLASVTLVSYIFLYTPLKRITPLSTIVGAFPGALPPVMGWTAARNEVNPEAVALFALLFVWQIPHFLSLAWMYRKDYARAGYRLLTVVEPEGNMASRQILAYTTLLVPLAVIPWTLGMFGALYLILALLLSLAFLVVTVHLVRDRSNAAARQVFAGSLIYLPALMAIMVVDRL
ncbi:MAG: ctaB2 [Deltaproteobacteria bacterium]|jgi:protoheme IX farnesyltransferase|nr:ctaB2 [Deltaproteobacteria bacterium]